MHRWDSVYQKTANKIKAQTLQDSIQTEKQIVEKVASYTQETEQARLAQKLQRRAVLRKRFEKEFAPYYEPAIAQIKKQKYKEMAIMYAGPYYRFTMPYLKSIVQKYPPHPDGTVAEETDVAFAVYTRQHHTIDSLCSSLPTVNTLPPAQHDSLVRIMARLGKELGF